MEKNESAATLHLDNEQPVDLSPTGLRVPAEDPGYSHESSPSVHSRGKLGPQFLAALAGNMGGFTTGTIFCWAPVAIPKIRMDEDFQNLTEDHLSWITAIVTMGATFASFPAGVTLDAIGRRKTMLCVTIPLMVGWFLLYFADSFEMLLSARVIGGLCYGAYQLGGPIFIAETVEARIRGMFISGFDLMICAGILFVYIVGALTPWRTLSLICAGVPVVFHCLMFSVPESPRFLITKGEHEKALQSLAWFRGSSASDAKAELQTMQDSIDKAKSDGPQNRYAELFTVTTMKSFVKCLCMMLLQIGSGIGVLTLYVVDIFASANSGMDAYLATIVIGTVPIISCLVSALIVDHLGRKMTLIISVAIMAVSLAAFGYYFYVKERYPDYASSTLHWLPLLCMIAIQVGYSFGLGPIPHSLLPELLPQRVRGIAMSILRIFRASASFLVTRYFKNFMAIVGADVTYWIFGGICVYGIFFVYFFIPETAGKSLEEIQTSLTKGRKSKNNYSE